MNFIEHQETSGDCGTSGPKIKVLLSRYFILTVSYYFVKLRLDWGYSIFLAFVWLLMTRLRTITPRITDLAEQLLGDIVARDLRPGDRYLTTVAASKMLGVGNGAANRALQLLERRSIIRRQQRSGAYIAALPDSTKVQPLRRVHFLVHQKFLRTEGVGNDELLVGMQDELPGVNVQISFMPTGDETQFVEELIADALKSSSVDGFILARASCETQRLLADSGLPVVVFGGVYSGVGRLARLDRDMHAVGRLLMEYLLQRGHRRIAYFNRQLILPGDHESMDAAVATMAAAGLPIEAFTMRCLPADTEVCKTEFETLLRRDNRPTGFICRTVRMAEAALMAIESLEPENRDLFEVVVCDYYLRSGDRPKFVFPRPVGSLADQGHHLARLLAKQARGIPEKDEVLIPVALDHPAAGGEE